LSNTVPARFEGIIFDVGDILYDASAWRRWLTDTLQVEGVDVTYQQLVERWEALLVDVYCGRAAYWDRFDALVLNLGLAEDRAPAIRDAAQQKAGKVQKDRSPMPGVPDTLRRLNEQGVKLGALSDTESGESKVRSLLKQLGIENYFDAVVTSVDIGIAKPDPKAYVAAALALKSDVEHCAFVGHDIDELEGSQQAGLYSIAYNYHPDAPADVYLEHFSELVDVIFEAEYDQR
jgi:putative hydrolase of the HAD superfamily